MDHPATDSQSRRHSLSDWLALHELDPALCRLILDAVRHEPAGNTGAKEGLGSDYRAPDLEAAWVAVAEAMRAFLPAQRDIIDDTFEKSVRMRVDQPEGSRKAATLDNGPAAYPTIVYSYRGEAPDWLVMAHEFGHALQIRAGRGKFVPPIMREVCAFISEGALLAHISQIDAARHAHLVQAWRSATRKNFGPQKSRLQAALLQPDAPYRYGWNYPIARGLALLIAGHFSPDRIWSVFEGDSSLRQVVRALAISP